MEVQKPLTITTMPESQYFVLLIDAKDQYKDNHFMTFQGENSIVIHTFNSPEYRNIIQIENKTTGFSVFPSILPYGSEITGFEIIRDFMKKAYG